MVGGDFILYKALRKLQSFWILDYVTVTTYKINRLKIFYK